MSHYLHPFFHQAKRPSTVRRLPLIVLIALFLFSTVSFGQERDSSLLAYVQITPSSLLTDLPNLVDYLTTPYTAKEDQFRSIYLWLTHYIEYDDEAINNKRINQNNQDILDRRKAICWGYATLLKAMCEQVEIPISIITGYVRLDLKEAPFLKYPNHAWNAVQLNGKWHLVDATWDSQHIKIPSAFYQRFKTTYYLPNPAHFITNHLPADPQWQLLKCPINIAAFQQPVDTLLQIVAEIDCDTIELSIIPYEPINYYDQQLQRAINVYQFNPTDDNRRELANTQIEYQEYLSEKTERLQKEQKIDSLISVQVQMIELCEVANSLTDLFDTQKENCAYNYFNHAVALSQLELTTENEQQNLKDMQRYFELAAAKLATLPQNIFTEQALQLSKDYVEYLNERLKNSK